MQLPILFWRLVTLKSSADEMPYSRVLCLLLVLLNMAVTAVAMISPDIHRDLAIKTAVISVLASGLCLYSISKYEKLSARFVQLWSAILLVDTICALLALGVFTALGMNLFTSFISIMLSTWSWWVSVQFIMQAFNKKLWVAIGFTFLMQAASVIALFLFVPELIELLNKADNNT